MADGGADAARLAAGADGGKSTRAVGGEAAAGTAIAEGEVAQVGLRSVQVAACWSGAAPPDTSMDGDESTQVAGSGASPDAAGVEGGAAQGMGLGSVLPL